MTKLPSFADADGPALIPAVAAGASCTTPECITCGDIAVEVTVLRLLPRQMAVVATDAGEEECSVALIRSPATSLDVAFEPKPGDLILVHAGEAIAIVRR